MKPSFPEHVQTTQHASARPGRSRARLLSWASTVVLVSLIAGCGGADGPATSAALGDAAPSAPTAAIEKAVSPHTPAPPLPALSAAAVIQPGIVAPESATGVRTGALPAAARSSTP